MNTLIFKIERHAWAVLISAIVLVFLLQLPTLTIDPPIYQDEVQIIDFGRSSLNPDTDWGISWNVQAVGPVMTPSYLSAAIQDFAYRLSQPSVLGPRLSALFAALLAAASAFLWLKARNTAPAVALLLALAFLIDPIFSHVYRLGRVDGYAIAACLGSCWLLRMAGLKEAAGKSSVKLLFGAGVLLVLSPFLWVTAPVLFPLVALEFFEASKNRWVRSSLTHTLRRIKGMAIPFMLGCAIGGLVLIIPILMSLDQYRQGLESSFAIQERAAAIRNSIIDMFLVHDPVLTIAAVVGIVINRKIGLLLALGIAVALIYQTMIYQPRVLYLIPYLLAIVAGAATKVFAEGGPRVLRLAVSGILTILILLNGFWLLIGRPVEAFKTWPGNDPRRLEAKLEHHIGPGDHKVLLSAWSAYYSGRALGWKIYRAGSPVSREEYLEFSRSMDFIVQPSTGSYNDFTPAELAYAGFLPHANVDLSEPGGQQNGEAAWSSTDSARGGYGGLLIFRNEKFTAKAGAGQPLESRR